MQEFGESSAGVENRSAGGTQCQGLHKKLEHRILFGTTSLQKGTRMQTWMESKHPDVKFTLEALVGSLTALTAEGR